jgi:hypothetical protein
MSRAHDNVVNHGPHPPPLFQRHSQPLVYYPHGSPLVQHSYTRPQPQAHGYPQQSHVRANGVTFTPIHSLVDSPTNSNNNTIPVKYHSSHPVTPEMSSPYQPAPHNHPQSSRRPLPNPRPQSMPPPVTSHSQFSIRPSQVYPTSSFPTSSFSNTVPTPPQSSSSSPTRSGYVSPTNSSPSRSGRPLPTPGSRQGSLSPTKGVTDPITSAGTNSPTKLNGPMSSASNSLPPLNDKGTSKFVPLWKRDRLNAGQGEGLLNMERSSIVDTSNGSGISGRPLPMSPTFPPLPPQNSTRMPRPQKSRTLPTPVHSDSESDEGGDFNPPSPQYGIRDLPSRSQGAGKLSQPSVSGPSVASRMAVLGLNGPERSTGITSQRSSSTIAPSSSGSPTKRSLPPAKGPGSVWSSGVPEGFDRMGNGKGKERERAYVDLDDEPPPSLRSFSPKVQQPIPRLSHHSLQRSCNPPFPASTTSPSTRMTAPMIESPAPVGGRDKRPNIPKISFPAGDDGSDSDSDDWHNGTKGPSIFVSQVPSISFSQESSVSVSQPPSISVSGPELEMSVEGPPSPTKRNLPLPPPKTIQPGCRLICGGCRGPIIGRIVNAMDMRWHPGCFRCSVCHELLEHVSSYEWEGRPYCHLDYHEVCKVIIVGRS